MEKLFTPYSIGNINLSNRIVMAPMTRSRASTGHAADILTAEYYSQRATAGLIITEGSQISVQGQGYLFTPGIFDDNQIKGWELTTKAVHEKGGKIFLQLWHVGRISHNSLQINNNSPVSSVSVRAENTNCYAWLDDGHPSPVPVSVPHEMSIAEIKSVVQDFIAAAKNAMSAGFDGVEIHAANGYLLEQFINGGLNTRDDLYGGKSVENRIRFTLEVTDAVGQAIGPEKTGIRLAPFGRLFDMHGFDGEEQTWLKLGEVLTSRRLAYVHLSDQSTIGAQAFPADFTKKFRDAYSGTIIIAGGFDKSRAEGYLNSGLADLIAFGQPYISNPDLVDRMKYNWALNEVDEETIYGGAEKGYTDYPFYNIE